MNISLLGITSNETVQVARDLGVNSFGFDLRPKSFNFVQGHKIKSIVEKHPDVTFKLLFENEKDFMVDGLYQDIKPFASHLEIEFTGITSLGLINLPHQPFNWHYHDQEKFKSIGNVSQLKKIIFPHSILESYQERGELFGFLQLFDDLKDHLEFRLLLDWNTEILTSMFEYMNFSGLSFEINGKIEKSYQSVDHHLMVQQLNYYKQLFLED